MIFLHSNRNPNPQHWAFVGYPPLVSCPYIPDYQGLSRFQISRFFSMKIVPEIPVNLVPTVCLTKYLLFLVTGQKSQVKLDVLTGSLENVASRAPSFKRVVIGGAWRMQIAVRKWLQLAAGSPIFVMKSPYP